MVKLERLGLVAAAPTGAARPSDCPQSLPGGSNMHRAMQTHDTSDKRLSDTDRVVWGVFSRLAD